jgi:diazepam-binding inhibitor (GABA receptor modulator, acyl-CoA-binding protein)
MELHDLFEQAVANSKILPEKPGNNVLLKLYAYYKQSTIGDINTEAPVNPFDFVANAKYNAWKELKGNPKETAMKEYIGLVTKLMSGA